jgi:hypothetical protein
MRILSYIRHVYACFDLFLVDVPCGRCHQWDPMLMISPCRFAERVPSACAGSSGYDMTMTIITTTTRFRGASG